MSSFRQTFTFVNKDVTKWFPGHMLLGMRQMQERLKSVNCFIELHDARIPFSGRNPAFFTRLTSIRPRILVFNKVDLIDKTQLDALAAHASKMDNCPILFTNCKDLRNNGLKKILPTAMELIRARPRYGQSDIIENLLMIIGVPNVGKSSMINQLRSLYTRRGKATLVGATPGVTRSVLERIKIQENPTVFLVDTPGILAPNIKDIEVGLKLALCAILKDHLVGEDVMADYLLYWFNKHENFKYVDVLNLKEPTDDIREVLFQVAVNLKKRIQVKNTDGTLVIRPNLHAAASHILRLFRSGDFGKINLDIDEINCDAWTSQSVCKTTDVKGKRI